jgi:ADP-heptose:LPS heptosyltransferase
MRTLKEAFPSAEMVAMGSPLFLPLARDYVNATIPNNLSGLHTLYSERSKIPKQIEELLGGFDLAISYTPDECGVFAENLRNIGIPWVIDGAFSTSEECNVPALERLITPLEDAGIPAVSLPPRIIPAPSDRQFAREFFSSSLEGEGLAPTIVAIHPGSGSLKKCWPPGKFAQLATWAQKTLGATIVLVLGPADQYTVKALDAFISTCKPILAKELPLSRVAAILERSTVYVGNDSGITHLAAAVGTPTLALFGPTDHRIWGPRNEQTRCLRGICHCAPCTSQAMAQCSDSSCMESLPIALVRRAVTRLIAHVGYSLPERNSTVIPRRKRYHVQG